MAAAARFARIGARLSGAACVVGGTYLAQSEARCFSKAVNSKVPASAVDTVPLSSLGYTLYQYEICPFCNKVKSLLDFFHVPYATVDVNPLTKSEIKFSEDYKKVPIMRTEAGEQLRDSPVIMEHILDNLKASGVLSAKDFDAFCSDKAREWATWADKELAVYIYPNITRSYSESLEAFSYIRDVPHFSALDKATNMYVGALAMVFAQGKIKKKYNIIDEREEMFDKLRLWTKEVGDKPFAGGDRPNLADIAVFGCVRAIKHTGTHKDIMANTDVGPWYKRMEDTVGGTSRRRRA